MQAHENMQPADHGIVSQMQLLHCAQALAQPGFYASLHLGGTSQGDMSALTPCEMLNALESMMHWDLSCMDVHGHA